MAGYYEIIVRGDVRDLVPYVAGYAEGSGASHIYFAHESGFHLKALRDRIKHHGEVQHIICPQDQRPRIKAALESAAARYEFEILEESKIERAYFHFGFDTPSRDVAAAIKKIIAKLPSGVTTMDYTPEEIIDPDAKGTEVYSPAHEFVFRGKGVIEGDVAGVIETRTLLADIEFVRCDEIDLHRP
jgi:hypothetical protein